VYHKITPKANMVGNSYPVKRLNNKMLKNAIEKPANLPIPILVVRELFSNIIYLLIIYNIKYQL
jgi:hypothetical protein